MSDIFFTKSDIIFTKSGTFFRVYRKIHPDSQALKKEVIPRSVQPPFLQCKDTTFFRRMQVGIFSRSIQFCEILRQSVVVIWGCEWENNFAVQWNLSNNIDLYCGVTFFRNDKRMKRLFALLYLCPVMRCVSCYSLWYVVQNEQRFNFYYTPIIIFIIFTCWIRKYNYICSCSNIA
jgi:hypothetical protein